MDLRNNTAIIALIAIGLLYWMLIQAGCSDEQITHFMRCFDAGC